MGSYRQSLVRNLQCLSRSTRSFGLRDASSLAPKASAGWADYTFPRTFKEYRVPTPQPSIATIVSAPFAENSYIAHFEGRDDCVVLDPGFEPEKIFAYIEEQQLAPAAFLITHGHADHIVGNAAMKDRWPDCPIVIGRAERRS